MIGKTLLHYEITAPIGAGGMGEVYRATDTALGRDVAIKLLPTEVAEDPERLARFRREAQLLASLNHPNVAAVHGLEEADGKPFLVLELVEGGLAKAWGGVADGSGSSADLSRSPTLAHADGTQAGVILGTAAYMSPEQASGKGVDKRADIWSFGVVLFEMLAGESLFSGETASEVMASVIKDEPAWDPCRPSAPRRSRSCSVAVSASNRGRGCTTSATRGWRSRRFGPGPRSRWRDPRATSPRRAAPSAGAAGASARRGRRRSCCRPDSPDSWPSSTLTEASPPPRAAHFVLDTADDLFPPDWGAPTVSPDGGQVVFTASDSDGRTMLWIRSLDAPGVRPLGGTEGASPPFWSPDGASLASSPMASSASSASPAGRCRGSALSRGPGPPAAAGRATAASCSRPEASPPAFTSAGEDLEVRMYHKALQGDAPAVDVRAADGRVEVGLPVGLFPGVVFDPSRDDYAVTADGQRFLVRVPVVRPIGARIHVVTNWTSLLR